MKAKLPLIAGGLFFFAASLGAQTPALAAPAAPPAVAAPQAPGAPPAPPRPPHDPLAEVLAPPELVMRHQQALGLTPEQKAAIREQMRQAQLRFTELQWQMEDAAEALRMALDKDQINEEQALVQLNRVLDTETQIKRLQLGLMIRIKNRLTAEQWAKLRELRQREPWAPARP